MERRTTIKVHLDVGEETVETLGWPRFKEFFDLFLEALAAMPGGPSPADVMPVAVRGGSITPVASVPSSALQSLQVLRKGPTKSWSARQRATVEPFYRWIRKTGAHVEVGARKLQTVVVPDTSTRWEIHELASVTGVVHRAGGKDGNVEIYVDDEKRVVCECGREIAAAVGAYLYKRVRVEGEIARDTATFEILRFKVDSFEPVEEMTRLDALKALQDLLQDVDIDPAEIIRERQA